ncbi:MULTISPECIES: hypothetical protein [unclassified Streptomyces]|uniref:hypothetical protein n=1 Tax=unclassified Streptomyces TaxID=2593676 RepID=UPI000823AD9C|nr:MULTISPECIES: hypothetical protein [unclassified Streptomyces]SCK63438.1 Predicted integral membrane protein [Streptomyces sp. AmelKG-E11A]
MAIDTRTGPPPARVPQSPAPVRVPGPAPVRRASRVAGWPRDVATVVGVHAAATAAHLAALSVTASAGGGAGVRDRLLSWDARLYLGIAEDGYPAGITRDADGEPEGSTLAFFPLYPLLVRLAHRTLGSDMETAALLTAHLAFLGALFAVHGLIGALYGTRTATITLVLVAAAQPMAVVLVMAYAESLFLALAAGALLAVRRGHWLTAGVLALLTGLTRPAAAALALALAVAVVLEIRRLDRVTWRPAAALALACAGTPGYLLWVAERTGRLDGYFVVQEAGWGTHWDFGAAFAGFLGDTFRQGDGWVAVSTAFLLLAACALTALAWRRGVWPPLLVYGTAMLVLTVGQSNYYHSKLRLLAPALLLLVPLAVRLARAPRRTVVPTLLAAALFGTWYGAHMLVTWRYAI